MTSPEWAEVVATELHFDRHLRRPNPVTPRAPLTMTLLEQGVLDAGLYWWRETPSVITTYWTEHPDGAALLPADILDVTEGTETLRWSVLGDTLRVRSHRRLTADQVFASSVLYAVNSWNLERTLPTGAIDHRSCRLVARGQVPMLSGTTPAEVAHIVVSLSHAIIAFHELMRPVVERAHG